MNDLCVTEAVHRVQALAGAPKVGEKLSSTALENQVDIERREQLCM
jgi:hypothetical protein